MQTKVVKKSLASVQDMLLQSEAQQVRGGKLVNVNGITRCFLELWKDYVGVQYAGTFEDGCTLTTDLPIAVSVLNGKAYSWTGSLPHTVLPGTDPAQFNSGYIVRTDIALRANLASSTGAMMIGFAQAGVEAAQRTVLEKLRDTIDARDFGVKGDGVTDDTKALQKACDAAAAAGVSLKIPGSFTCLVRPKTNVQWEAGNFVVAILMRSDLTIVSNGGKIKIADNVSTDASPVHHQMFFSNEVLHDVSFIGVKMDMNGQNNKISPNRASKSFNRYMNAPICVSGTIGGAATAASIDNCLVYDCEFTNLAGVSGIVCAQSNTPGHRMSNRWNIMMNRFYNVGLDTDDHSTIFGKATNSLVVGNVFDTPSTIDPAVGTGGLCAVELHGSGNIAAFNFINNYEQAFWAASNFAEVITSGIHIFGNVARVNSTFVDFWSKNLLPWGEPEGVIKEVVISNNTIEILGKPTAYQVRSFLKLGARQQPAIVKFTDNVCRSFDTAGNTVLALIVVGADQRFAADQISITDNVAAGIRAGLVCFFDGDPGKQDINRVTFRDNDLGYLAQTSQAGLQAADVYLYGPKDGKINELTVGGLQQGTNQIITDARPSGRATVFGEAILPIKVTWNGVTPGNSALTSRVALNTHSGIATVAATLTVGSTAVLAGSIYPKFTGLSAITEGGASASLIKASSAVSVPCRVYATADYVSLYTASGTALSAADIVVNSYLGVTATIPCRSASI